MQYDYGVIDPVPTTGVDLSNDLNLFRDALHSTHLGPSRPPYARQGMLWIGTGATTAYTLYVFDGLRDQALVRWDTSTGRVAAVGSLPVGAIIDFSGTTSALPAEWALCDGGLYPRSDGTGTVRTPDLRGLFVMGATASQPAGTTGGIAEGVAGSTDFAGDHTHTETVAGGHTHSLGSAGDHSHGGGTAGTSLTVGQLPPHVHSESGMGGMSSGQNPSYVASPGQRNLPTGTNTGSTGSGEPHAHGIANDGGHTHSVGIDGWHSHTINPAGGHAHNIAQRYPRYYTLAKIMRV